MRKDGKEGRKFFNEKKGGKSDISFFPRKWKEIGVAVSGGFFS